MALDCYRQIAQLLPQEPIVLATVIQVTGSVPREVGAKMVIWGAGQTWQTIGGGAGEAKVIQQALKVLTTGEKTWVEIDLTGNLQGSIQRVTEGVCGGKMRVWLERWQGAAAIALTQQILDSLQSGQPITIVTPLDTMRSPYELPSTAAIASEEGLENAFVETLQPPPTLLIVGAGHCGIQLAKVAHLIGFQIIVQDDRSEWANTQHYPQATQIYTESITSTVAQLASHTQLYAALVTRGYQHDLAALEVLLQRDRPCEYIGMIGSEKRVRQVFQAIIQTGISPDRLRSVYAPIGLDIGALTPEEIAVSISAELILVRRGGTGRSLRDRFKNHY